MANAEPAIREKVKTKLDIPPPNLYRVIYMNDEVTTMEFVVMSLMEIFNHSPEDAEKICINVHKDGSAIVAVLPYELAEQKGVEATMLARNNGFPLLIRLEPAV
jgi:ATP-dependent Clp protease adaptor protein ClpS